jgi:hypothetical protein
MTAPHRKPPIPNKNIIVRYGPAPGDTEDENGNINATFTGYFILNLSAVETARLFTGTQNSSAFVNFVRTIWDQVTAPKNEGGYDAGHILIGSFTDFAYLVKGSVPSCGFVGATDSGVKYTLSGYAPLYAIARAKKGSQIIDYAVDYRAVTPGDTNITPFTFPPS